MTILRQQAFSTPTCCKINGYILIAGKEFISRFSSQPYPEGTLKIPECERSKRKRKLGKTTVCTESVSCQEIPSSHNFPAGNILPGGTPPDAPKGCVHNSTIKTNISELSKKKILLKISGCSCWNRIESCRNVTEYN
jgi:hypothetical protein